MISKKCLVIFALLFAQLFINVSCVNKNKSEAKRDILNQILPTNPNDILVAPGNGTSGPTTVRLFLHVKSIDNLNDEKMEMTNRFYIRMLWKDLRLQYDGDKNNITNIVINDPRTIWTPDVYISNLLKGYSHDMLSRNTFIRIFPDGTVLYSMGVLITTSCPMNLKRFPFDTQICEVLLSTYGSTTEDVVLMWKEVKPATILMDARLDLFSLEHLATYSRVATVSIGSYNILVLSFLFKREVGHYLVRVFIPCVMLVILSWISLWVSRKRPTIRLILGLSALLTCTLLVYEQNTSMAKISYSTAMDYFTGMSLTFIFVSVLETTIVYVLGEKFDGFRVGNEEVKGSKQSQKWFAKILEISDKIDRWARLIIPMATMLFYAIYFFIGHSMITEESSLLNKNYPITSAFKI